MGGKTQVAQTATRSLFCRVDQPALCALLRRRVVDWYDVPVLESMRRWPISRTRSNECLGETAVGAVAALRVAVIVIFVRVCKQHYHPMFSSFVSSITAFLLVCEQHYHIGFLLVCEQHHGNDDWFSRS